MTPRHTLSHVSRALALLAIIGAPLGAAEEPAAAAATTPQSSEQMRGPRDYEGRLVLFPDDTTAYTEEELKNAVVTENVFAAPAANRSLARLRELVESLTRLYEAFMHGSNLSAFDKNTNPYAFQGDDAARLPDDAVIAWKMNKQELVALKLPFWDTLVIGGANAGAYLDAWVYYQEYTSARLRLELLDARGADAPRERAGLQDALRRAKDAVVEYFKHPPVD